MCSSLPAAGVLWLSMIAEFMYISLLGMGFLLMWVEVLCAHKEMHALKINAFAAICTVLSGKPAVLGSLLWHILVLQSLVIIANVYYFGFPLLFSFRAVRDGGSYDVHYCISANCDCRAQRLETSDVGLWLVICVSTLTY